MNTITPDAEDPLTGLRLLAAERRSQQTEWQRREGILVRRARAQGYSWHAIASMLELSRQAVHKRYGRA